MTMQYEQNQINLQGISATSSLIYAPGSAIANDIIYTDWLSLLAAAQAKLGLVDIIISSPGAIATIPAGVYDMTDICLVGEDAFTFVEVNDAVFNNLRCIRSLVVTVGTTVANTVPSFVYSNGALNEILFEQTSLLVGALATAPMVDVSAGTPLAIAAWESSFISSAVGVPVFSVDATSGVTTATINASGTQGNNWGGGPGSPPFLTIAPGGTFALTLGTGDVFFGTNQVTPPTTITRKEDYEAAGAVGVEWLAVVPTDFKTAVDRIAASVAAAHGPIP